jgi:DNA-directed RNA polymerase subunit RPC12/RpoP
MGLLDDILNAPQKTKDDYFNPYGKQHNDDKIKFNCETCGREFSGQSWMMKSKKSITCPSCWGAEKRNEEFN